MKILAFTDVHGDLELMEQLKNEAKDVDLVICTGDFTLFGRNTSKMLDSFESFPKPVILLHGNHEDVSEVKRKSRLLENVFFLHEKVFEFGSYLFVAHGGGGFSYTDASFRRFIQKEESKIQNNKNLILLTHQPPYGTVVDDIGTHVGNIDYMEFIKRYDPILSLSGHIHETFGLSEQYDETLIMNPGPFGVVLEFDE